LSTNDATRHCHLPRTAAVTKGEGGAGMGVGVAAELKGCECNQENCLS